MNKFGRVAVIGIMAAVVLTLAGCGGEKSHAVKGKLEENKVALKTPDGLPPGTKPILLSFYPVDGKELGEPEHAVVDDDGNFTVPGRKGKGIPAGTYRIVVEMPKPGTHGAGPMGFGGPGGGPPGVGPGTGRPGTNVMGMQDRFSGAFSKDRSPLTVEITEDTELLIDVGGKGKVTTVE